MALLPEEIRIGNWYLSTKWQKPVKCELSDLAQLEFDCAGAELDTDIIEQMFQPISLTKEWLLKFGFIKKQYHYVLLLDNQIEENYWFEVHFKEENEEFYIKIGEGDEKTFIGYFKYVHQLQNLYSDLSKNYNFN